MATLACDYLVVGGGASGLAFVDELIHRSKDLTVVLVDRRAKPGGHWVDAYEFVRLHQPAAFYGVSSRRLETKGGGGCDLASKAQILAYYELVLVDLVATGRVTWLPQSDYRWDGRVESRTQKELVTQVTIRRKTVDATRSETHVPSNSKPNYTVADGITLVPINHLSRLARPWERYVVIGAGKTGIDAVLHLLDSGVDSDNITWIISKDCWFANRDPVMSENCGTAITQLVKDQVECFMTSETVTELYHKLEKKGIVMRLDSTIEPAKNRNATVSTAEMAKLRTIQNMVRKGRIERITEKEIIFANGDVIETSSSSLHIDCSTASTGFLHPKQLFIGNTINLQMVMLPQPCYSASIIAAMEVKFPDDEDKKNELTPIGISDLESMSWDLSAYWLMLRDMFINQEKVAKLLGIPWLWGNRLSGFKFFGFIFLVKVAKIMGKMQGDLIKKIDAILDNSGEQKKEGQLS